MTAVGDTFYRYEDLLVSAGVDEFDNPLGPAQVRVYLHQFQVIRVTPKGVWIDGWFSKRFVLNEARKRYALPTKDEALQSFLARKERQASIYQTRVSRADQAIKAALAMHGKNA